MSADFDAIVKTGLHTLGKHPFSLNHAFLGLRLNEKDISDISLLSKYPLLMYVDVASNDISDLSSLAELPTLLQLNASNNRITECLEFEPVVCSASNAWSSGHKSIGSMLTLANLSNNNIERIRDLHRHPFLECLLLSRNSIKFISGLQSLKFLKVLDLSYNTLTSIEGIDFLPIEELNVEGNNLTTLDGLQNSPNLSVLNVSKNHIQHLQPAGKNTSLTVLDVQDNHISFIREVEHLAGLSWIRILKLSGNPCCSKPSYRARVVSRLQQITKLDLSTVSAEEKIRALNLYRLPGGDVESRQAVFGKYFPGEPVENGQEFEDDEGNFTA